MSASYITAAGYQNLQDEHRQLVLRRREVVKALSAAAAEGDRSENAEYIYRKKELREVDRRLRYLSRRLDELKVVEQKPSDQNKVYFGAWVEREDEAGESHRYRIVGADETSPELGMISMHAPMAKALIGRRLDDEITLNLPAGRKHFYIVDVSYE